MVYISMVRRQLRRRYRLHHVARRTTSEEPRASAALTVRPKLDGSFLVDTRRQRRSQSTATACIGQSELTGVTENSTVSWSRIGLTTRRHADHIRETIRTKLATCSPETAPKTPSTARTLCWTVCSRLPSPSPAVKTRSTC